MPKRSNLKFEQVKSPITEQVSKFGGQPNWVSDPEWPLDKFNKKMLFVGQLELSEELFSDASGKMAYIFIADDEEGQGTWEPDGGLNAIIVQPGSNSMPTISECEGPTCPMIDYPLGFELDENGLAEFRVIYDYCEEPEYLNEEQIGQLIDQDEESFDEYAERMEISKIGGNPFFIQSEEIPFEGGWKFLCQLQEEYMPVWVNFGTGVAYAFINENGDSGKLLWQC